MNGVLAVYREPFGFAPRVQRLPEGLNLSAMRARVRGLPDDFDTRGVICINGQPVPRGIWPLVKPKATSHGVPIEVTFHAPVMGGGGEDGGKQILALVASIALTVLTGAILGGSFATAGGLFAKGSLSASFLAAGVSLGASLLMSALAPPPTVDNAKKITNPGAASAEGNALEPNGPAPRVIGTRKVFPPLACEPLVYFDGPDEVVEVVYILAGPHQLNDIRVGAAQIDSLSDLEYETHEGWPGDARLLIATRHARTESVQAELRGHTVADSDGRTIESSTGDTTSALPQAQVIATRRAPDEHQLQIMFGQGLHYKADETIKMRVPFRLRMREIGSATWIDLPELHFQAANVRQLRATIRLIWTTNASTTPGAANGSEGWVEARIASPGQVVSPATAAWAADAYFELGSGDGYMSSANLGTTGVDHVSMTRYEAAIYLDEATFPRGRYEVEIKRGAAFDVAGYSSSAYTVSSVIWDLWGYQGTPGLIVQTRDGVSDSAYLLRSVSIWNEHPLPTDDFATIGVRARNRAIEALSCVASGWVRDWDGTGWNDWIISDNPAPHFRDILAGAQNADPLPADIIDDAGLVEWRDACTIAGFRCNAIIEGGTVDEAARIIAGCGYAKPYMSEVWGVVRDYDRSAESPVQIFTPRNSSGFQWTKAFARVPDGLRVNWRDENADYDTRQTSVFRPGISADSGLLEQITYEGLTTEAEITARARYDLAQPISRGTFYSLDAPAEAIVARRGSLVGVAHDMLGGQFGAGRIVDIERDGAGDVLAIWLDSEVPLLNEPAFHAVTDLLAIDDMTLIGARSGAAIRRSSGTTVHEVDNASGSTTMLQFAAPISDAGLGIDALVAVGPLAQEYLRLIVFGVTPRENLTASLTLVEEAPELWS